MNSINSLLNAIFLVGLCVLAYCFFTSPKDFGPPPDNAWFQSVVINQPGPVVVKFGADWCGPCRMMEPVLDQFSMSEPGVSVVRINVDQHGDLAQHYGVSSIPRLFLFEQGKVIGDRVGYLDEQQLRDWVIARTR